MGAREALALGLVDRSLAPGRHAFAAARDNAARQLAVDARWETQVAEKRRRREADERERPLADYRKAELARMRDNFYGFDPSYHVARYNFVYKVPRSRTPLTIASHRRAAPDSLQRHAS